MKLDRCPRCQRRTFHRSAKYGSYCHACGVEVDRSGCETFRGENLMVHVASVSNSDREWEYDVHRRADSPDRHEAFRLAYNVDYRYGAFRTAPVATFWSAAGPGLVFVYDALWFIERDPPGTMK
ncbi:MAG: hypothetical protein ABFD84_17125 [Candidatus Polarisedimenticolia bacterium]